MPAEYCPTVSSRTLLGSLSRNSTVWSSIATTSSSIPRPAAPDLGSSGSVMRSNVKTTSSAVSGFPSWKTTPLRIVAVHTVASSLGSNVSARR